MKQVRTAKCRLTLLTLAVAMLLALFFVPQRASAVDQDSDVYIRDTTTSSWYTWATLDATTKTITLTNDVDFDMYCMYFVSGTWTLDLNGKTIIGHPAIEVEADANLTIIGDGRIKGDMYFSGSYLYGDGINVDEGILTIRGGDIVISGSMIQDSSNRSSAICIDGGTLNIESGNITLSGMDDAVYSYKSTVNISGGDVTMNGVYGIFISNSAMEISGGNITINSTSTSFVPSGGTATISGGAVSVTNLPSTYTHTGGVIHNQTTGVVTVSNLAEDYTIPANATLTVAEGETLTLNDGAVLTVGEGGTLVNNGTIHFNDGAKVVNNGTVTNNGALFIDDAEHHHELTAQYTDLGDGTHQLNDTCLDCPIGYVETSVAEHMYTYKIIGVSITEFCHRCDFENELSLSGEETITYNGNAYSATIHGAPINPAASVKLQYFNELDESLGEAAPADAGKYTIRMEVLANGESLCRATAFPFTIEPKQLIPTGVIVYDKTYDGIQTVELSELLVDGIVAGDDVTVTVDMATVDSADAGKYTQVNLSGIALTGEDAGNYTMDDSARVNVINYWDEEDIVTIYPAQVYINALEQSVALNDTLDQTKWAMDECSELLEGHYVAQVALIGDTSVSTDYGSVVPADAVILDEAGKDMTKNYNVTYQSALLRVTCPDHDTFKNGFCSFCNGYQKAVWNEEEYIYEISNAGQLYWYAQYLNATNAEIYAELTADIVIPENAPNWEPINTSYVYFNGNFHTISGLKCIGIDRTYVGLFGNEGWWYDISNLHIEDSYFEGSNYVGAVVACMSNGGSVTNCYVTNTTVKGDSGDVGGLVGYLGGHVSDCYSTATVVGENGAVLVGYSNGNGSIENCYFLSETETEDGGKTAAQFASGEVAYLFQGDQSEHIWGQKIGTDDSPVFGGAKVYVVSVACTTDAVGYSNINEDLAHNYVNGICTVCGEEKPPRVNSWSLSLHGDIRVNFLLKLENTAATVEITADGETFLFNASDLSMDGNLYKATVGIAAAQMTKPITVKILEGEEIKFTKSYTVRQYCDTVLADESNSQYHALIKEMLNYGAMAQLYFDYDAENLANADITGVAAQDVPETTEEMVVNGIFRGLQFYGASLVYRDRIAVRFYFTGDITGCNFTANDNPYTPVAKDAMHYVEIADILPQDLDQQITLTVTDADGNTVTITYGPMNYIVRMNAKGSDEVKALLKALYNYHLAAKNHSAEA